MCWFTAQKQQSKHIQISTSKKETTPDLCYLIAASERDWRICKVFENGSRTCIMQWNGKAKNVLMFLGFNRKKNPKDKQLYRNWYHLTFLLSKRPSGWGSPLPRVLLQVQPKARSGVRLQSIIWTFSQAATAAGILYCDHGQSALCWHAGGLTEFIQWWYSFTKEDEYKTSSVMLFFRRKEGNWDYLVTVCTVVVVCFWLFFMQGIQDGLWV